MIIEVTLLKKYYLTLFRDISMLRKMIRFLCFVIELAIFKPYLFTLSLWK